MQLHLSPKQRAVYIGIGCLFLGGLGYVGIQRAKPPAEVHIETGTPAPKTSIALRPNMLTVDVGGAVVKPGVYQLAEGSRYQDAIGAAGGPTSDANLEPINQAQKLSDGAQVRVPRISDPQQPAPIASEALGTATPSRRTGRKIAPPEASIDLNTASSEELQLIPGIGAATAGQILELRNKLGRFDSVEQLEQLRGLNGKRFDSIRKYFKI